MFYSQHDEEDMQKTSYTEVSIIKIQLILNGAEDATDAYTTYRNLQRLQSNYEEYASGSFKKLFKVKPVPFGEWIRMPYCSDLQISNIGWVCLSNGFRDFIRNFKNNCEYSHTNFLYMSTDDVQTLKRIESIKTDVDIQTAISDMKKNTPAEIWEQVMKKARGI
jgi:hypothetical protein